jgi:hypothetical protein
MLIWSDKQYDSVRAYAARLNDLLRLMRAELVDENGDAIESVELFFFRRRVADALNDLRGVEESMTNLLQAYKHKNGEDKLL